MRDSVYRDRQLENLEELLLDLRGGAASPLSAYVDDDDSVTRVLELPVRVAGASPRPPARVTSACVSPAPRSPEPRAAEPRSPEPRAAEPRSPEPRSPAVAAVAAPRPSAAAEPQALVPPELDLERVALESGSLRVKRAVMAVSALAMTGIFVTLFAISTTGEDRVRAAARQREAAAALKAEALERATAAPDSTGDEPADEPADETEDEPRSRQRTRGVPRGAAAMVMDADEEQSAERAGRAGATKAARQRF